MAKISLKIFLDNKKRPLLGAFSIKERTLREVIEVIEVGTV